MGLVGLLKGMIGVRPKGLSAQELRKTKPVRNPHVQYLVLEDGAAALEAPLATQGRGWLGAMAKASKMPDTKKFELEPVGAFVWELCDGSHNFETISRKLRERFKMSRVESDASLAAFLQMLHDRRLITVAMPKK